MKGNYRDFIGNLDIECTAARTNTQVIQRQAPSKKLRLLNFSSIITQGHTKSIESAAVDNVIQLYWYISVQLRIPFASFPHSSANNLTQTHS